MLFVPRVVVLWCPATPALPPGWWDGVAFLCKVLFASTITQTVTSFTRKHWQVPRFGSNLFQCGPRAGGYSIPSSPIIHVLQPLHLQHQEFSVLCHKPPSLLFFPHQFCWLPPAKQQIKHAELEKGERRGRQITGILGIGTGSPAWKGRGKIAPCNSPVPMEQLTLEGSVSLTQWLVEVKAHQLRQLLGKVWDPWE